MSPTRFQGDDFRRLSSLTSSSCFASAASLAAIVSFFAETVERRASASARRVSLNSLRTASVRVAVSSRSRSAEFSRSRASMSLRETPSSSAAAAQALTICDGLGLIARMAEFGELGAEFGGCAFDAANSTSTADDITSIFSIVFETLKLFILL